MEFELKYVSEKFVWNVFRMCVDKDKELRVNISSDYDLEYFRILAQEKLQVSLNYDRTIITLSTSSIGLSFVLIKDMYELTLYPSICWLGISWFFLLISIISVVISMNLSQEAHELKLEAFSNDSKPPEEKAKKIEPWIGHFNKISGVGFLIGIIILSVTIIGNI